MSSLQQRIAQAIEAGFTQADLMRATGKSSGAVSFWANGQTRDLKADSAIGLANLTGWNVQWWAEGKGPRENVDRGAGVAHEQSQARPTLALPETRMISWRDAVMETPEHFTLEVMDDAMAPLLSKGDVVRFSRVGQVRPRAGRIVLVADRNDKGYIRFFEDGGDEFTAAPQARSGYRVLEEKRDGLRVVALWMGYEGET